MRIAGWASLVLIRPITLIWQRARSWRWRMRIAIPTLNARWTRFAGEIQPTGPWVSLENAKLSIALIMQRCSGTPLIQVWTREIWLWMLEDFAKVVSLYCWIKQWQNAWSWATSPRTWTLMVWGRPFSILLNRKRSSHVDYSIHKNWKTMRCKETSPDANTSLGIK